MRRKADNDALGSTDAECYEPLMRLVPAGGFRVQSLGFGVQGFGCRGSRVLGVVFRVEGRKGLGCHQGSSSSSNSNNSNKSNNKVIIAVTARMAIIIAIATRSSSN